jgi:hypothetical protein
VSDSSATSDNRTNPARSRWIAAARKGQADWYTRKVRLPLEDPSAILVALAENGAKGTLAALGAGNMQEFHERLAATQRGEAPRALRELLEYDVKEAILFGAAVDQLAGAAFEELLEETVPLDVPEATLKAVSPGRADAKIDWTSAKPHAKAVDVIPIAVVRDENGVPVAMANVGRRPSPGIPRTFFGGMEDVREVLTSHEIAMAKRRGWSLDDYSSAVSAQRETVEEGQVEIPIGDRRQLPVGELNLVDKFDAGDDRGSIATTVFVTFERLDENGQPPQYVASDDLLAGSAEWVRLDQLLDECSENPDGFHAAKAAILPAVVAKANDGIQNALTRGELPEELADYPEAFAALAPQLARLPQQPSWADEVATPPKPLVQARATRTEQGPAQGRRVGIGEISQPTQAPEGLTRPFTTDGQSGPSGGIV